MMTIIPSTQCEITGLGYSRNHSLFSFPLATKMFKFARFALELVRYHITGNNSEISGSQPNFLLPKLIAGYHVLLRLLVPRHSSLNSLLFRKNSFSFSYQRKIASQLDRTCYKTISPSSLRIPCYDLAPIVNRFPCGLSGIADFRDLTGGV